MPRTGFGSFVNVYTRASTAAGERRFFPLAGALEARDGRLVHPQADIFALTGDGYLEFAVQASDDPENWPAASAFTTFGGASATSEGLFVVAGFADLGSLLDKAYWRPGVAFRNNTSGARIEHAMVSGRFDVRAG